MFTMIMTIDNHLLCDIGDYKIGASKTNTGIFLDVPVKAKYQILLYSYMYIIIMFIKGSNDDQQVLPITFGLY